MRRLRRASILFLLVSLAVFPQGLRAGSPLEGLRRWEAPPRLVAFGDVHGDYGQLRAVLRLAGAIDEADRWIGGRLWVVHTGDYLDRGDGELRIMELFRRLEGEAEAAGGRLVVLNANHEIMNVAWIFRFVTEEGFRSFRALTGLDLDNLVVKAVAEERRHRAAAFMPGGPMALRLAANPLYAIVGDTLFIHAGVSPAHVLYGLARMEQELQAWMRGEGGDCPAVLEGRDAPVWMRNYSSTEAPPDCGMLAEVLGSLGLRRMVVGHTVQPHVNAACDGHVWRIDTGMSAVYGGPVEALEIRGDVLRVLSRQEPPAAQH